jgi:tetratricopeptide (TPR) repeat protein
MNNRLLRNVQLIKNIIKAIIKCMKKKYLFTIILFITISTQNIFSEDIIRSEDTTFITKEMVSPTENKEAMEAYNKGTYLLRQNRFEEAEKYFFKAIELDNKYVDAIDHLGLVYRHMKKYEDSEKMYLLSIEINPNNTVPYINLAIVYRLQGRYEDARQSYLKAQKIDTNDPEPYFGIGVLYQIVGMYEMSMSFINIAIQKYIDINSNLICDAYYVQGNNYYFIDEFDTALKYYKAALIYYPNDKEIQKRISEIEDRLK